MASTATGAALPPTMTFDPADVVVVAVAVATSTVGTCATSTTSIRCNQQEMAEAKQASFKFGSEARQAPHDGLFSAESGHGGIDGARVGGRGGETEDAGGEAGEALGEWVWGGGVGHACRIAEAVAMKRCRRG